MTKCNARARKNEIQARKFGSIADRMMPLLVEAMEMVRAYGDGNSQQCAIAIQSAIGWATDGENVSRGIRP